MMHQLFIIRVVAEEPAQGNQFASKQFFAPCLNMKTQSSEKFGSRIERDGREEWRTVQPLHTGSIIY
jgi:hypothetical protein